MVGALSTAARSKTKSGSIPPISSTRRHRPCPCLYYVDDPNKLFFFEEHHYENHKALLLFPAISTLDPGSHHPRPPKCRFIRILNVQNSKETIAIM